MLSSPGKRGYEKKELREKAEGAIDIGHNGLKRRQERKEREGGGLRE